MCECNWIHKQNLKALENYFSRTPNLTTIRWKVLISWFYFRKKKLAMMTVQLVWPCFPWRRRRGTCLFVYLFVSNGKDHQELLCLFVCLLTWKRLTIKNFIVLLSPTEKEAKNFFVVFCLFTSHVELLADLVSLVSCHTTSDPLPLLLQVLELKTLSSSYQLSPQPHSLKPGTMVVLL